MATAKKTSTSTTKKKTTTTKKPVEETKVETPVVEAIPDEEVKIETTTTATEETAEIKIENENFFYIHISFYCLLFFYIFFPVSRTLQSCEEGHYYTQASIELSVII